MDSIRSVSKGNFIFKNGNDLKKLRKQKNLKLVNVNNASNSGYLQYKVQLKLVEAQIEQIKSSSNEKILKNLIDFITNINFESKNLQTAVLLTGVNQTDHLRQFEVLSQQIANNCHSITTILESRNCPSVKSAVESIVSGIVKQFDPDLKLKRKQLTLQVLQAWYEDSFESQQQKPSLIIMLNDFDQFDSNCVKDLITILISAAAHLPIVLVIGVATAFKTLQNVLPSHIMNRMDTNVFQSKSSTDMLNQILEKVILNPKASFHLSGRSFKILMDIFLFYDYSLHSFLQGYKIFMLEHFISRPLNCRFNKEKLSHAELESIRKTCSSFRKYVEAQKYTQNKINLIEDDKIFADLLPDLMKENDKFWHEFHLSLRILEILFDDLPKNDLGKLLRELYPICIADDITKLDEFKESFGLLKFTSKDKFLVKISKILKLLNRSDYEDLDSIREIHENLKFHSTEIENAGKNPQPKTPSSMPSSPAIAPAVTKSRHELMKMLKDNAANNPQRVMMEYEQKLYACLDYLNEILTQKLRSIHQAPPLHELFIFTDAHLVRRQIVGAPRGSIHNALTNPPHYLQCSCCEVQDNEQILPTLPDLAIAYKLHLECNKNINLYDWLQAFSMVIETDEDRITPEMQARFTRAVAELQFLGLIKQAKHKADHVLRLTW